MNKVKEFIKKINFKTHLMCFCFVVIVLSFLNSIDCALKVSPSEYYSRQISSKKDQVVLVQECSGVNFLSNNDFYVGYEFNYYYTTNYIKTFFHSNIEETNYYFFSSNTGMSASKYLAPNICGLQIVSGNDFSAEWNEDECYLSESMFNDIFGDTPFNYQNVVVNDYSFKIIGVVGDDCLSASNSIFSKKRIYVTYRFASKNLNEHYELVSIFEKKDYVGNKRYLDYYFGRYLGHSVWKNRMELLYANGKNVEIENKRFPNMPFVFIGIIALLTFLFLLIKRKKDFLIEQLFYFNPFSCLFIILATMALQLAFANVLFVVFSYVLTARAIVLSFIFLIIITVITNHFKNRLSNSFAFTDKYCVINI